MIGSFRLYYYLSSWLPSAPSSIKTCLRDAEMRSTNLSRELPPFPAARLPG